MTRLVSIVIAISGIGNEPAKVVAPIALDSKSPWTTGRFEWQAGPPLVEPPRRDDDDTYYSIKDPTIVHHDGHWHLFCTIRAKERTHQIEYLRFKDWDAESIHRADRTLLALSDGYFCAPQVFYFRPHQRWYLIHQVAVPNRSPGLQPAFSTTKELSDGKSWTRSELLFLEPPAGPMTWIDFWVIADASSAHLFFTSLDGRMWRSDTPLDRFPQGWSEPKVVLESDIFEASHTYRLRRENAFITLVEAQGPHGRYFKAYRSTRLDGDWQPIADTLDKPFAGPANVDFKGARWADSISHGELLRAGIDERLEIDPQRVRFLFQGALQEQTQGKVYGQIPWRLGLLELKSPSPD